MIYDDKAILGWRMLLAEWQRHAAKYGLPKSNPEGGFLVSPNEQPLIEEMFNSIVEENA